MEKVGRTKEEKLLRRREGENDLEETIHKKLKVKRKTLKKQKKLKIKYRTFTGDYTFLQYLPLLYLWATETKGIRRRDLDMLFYLSPLMVFQPKQLLEAQAKHGFRDPRMITRFKKGGWIRVYSTDSSKGFTRIYYTLTRKSSDLISKMYSMLLLEEPLPMHYNNNSLVARYESKKDENVMSALLEFNRRVREKAENKT